MKIGNIQHLWKNLIGYRCTYVTTFIAENFGDEWIEEDGGWVDNGAFIQQLRHYNRSQDKYFKVYIRENLGDGIITAVHCTNILNA